MLCAEALPLWRRRSKKKNMHVIFDSSIEEQACDFRLCALESGQMVSGPMCIGEQACDFRVHVHWRAGK
eukprot:1159735-Pelagomonas_calceolata.AAC.5